MYHKKSEKGQALVIIALAAVGLVAFAALAIDGSRVFSDRRHAQNAADTAALAAALAKIRTPDYPPNTPEAPDLAAIAAGIDRAASNGYQTDADSDVQVHICDEVGLNPPCQGLPALADPSEYIQVVIRLTTNTTFARIIGRPTVPSMVTAVARAKPGGNSPLSPGAALVALAPTGAPTIRNTGNPFLEINGSGIFNNSDTACSLTVSGNPNVTVETSFTYAPGGSGCYDPSHALGNITDSTLHQPGAAIPYPPAYDIPTPDITCPDGPGSVIQNGVDYTYSPGSFNGININTTGTVTFNPGNYCFDATVDIRGTADVIADNVRFLITAGEFQLNGSGSFTCSDGTTVLVHITDAATGFVVNGNSTNICHGITFFASTGTVKWLGNPTIDFAAPSDESNPYAHVLIYMPHGNTSPLLIRTTKEWRRSKCWMRLAERNGIR